MKALYSIFCILSGVVILVGACKKTDPEIEEPGFFVKFYGGSLSDVGNDVLQTSDNGYLIVGSTTNVTRETDVVLIKTDASGNEIWNKTFGDTLNDRGYSVKKTGDGGYVIVGTKIDAVEKENVYLIKVDYLGNIIWEKSYGNLASEEGLNIKETNDGGYIIVGYSDEENPGNGNPSGENDILLIKTNAGGDSLWAKRYGGALSETGVDVVQKDDGGFIVFGNTFSFSEPGQDGSNLILIETNENGILIDKFTYGGMGNETAASLVKLDDGFLIAGVSVDIADNDPDIYCIRIGQNIHNVTWEKTFGGDNAEYCERIISVTNGGYVVVGATESFGEGKTDTYIIEIDGSGNELKSNFFGGTGDEKGNSVAESSIGGFVIVGSSLTDENSMITLTKINADFELK